MNNPTLVQVNHLSRYYGEHLAVNDVSFEVHRGEIVGFLGPNGAGKSTTMQMITGNLAPSAGQVLINGIDMAEQPKLAKSELGFLPEHPPLYKELTVDEYLTFCARLHRVSKSTLSSALGRAKERCGLTDVGKRLIGNLSKGYQQRVGIAQAIIHSPAVVILDEPTVGLDPIQIRQIRTLIRELGNDYSVILSSHILPEIQATCNRVKIINNGNLVFSDTLASLQQQMHSSSLLIACQRLPDHAQLLALPGVANIDIIDDHRLRLHHTPTQNPATQLVELSVTQGWGLYELTPEHLSLEQIFVNITTSEPESDSSRENAA